jgi:hypothetical protein
VTRLVARMTTALLLLASCGTGDRGGDASLSEAPVGPVTTAEPPSLVAPSPSTTAPPAVVDARPPGSTAAPARSTTTAPPGQVVAPTAVPPPPPGTYRYDTTGQASYPVLGAASAPYPAVTTLVVDPPTGTRQHVTRDLKDASGNGPVVETGFDYRPDGVYLESLGMVVSVLVFSGAQEFRPPSPTLVLPTDARPGYSQELGVPGQVAPARLVIEAVREERVRVGGQDLETILVRLTATTTGQFNGRMELSVWLDRSTGVWAKERSATKARSSDGILLYESHYEATLQQLAPT